MPIRTFVFEQGTSHKFWSVQLSRAQHTVSWGRVGTVGQSKTKVFADAAEAQASAEKLLGEKLAKGYVEEGAAPAPPARPAQPSPSAHATGTPAASEPAAASEPQPQPAAASEPQPEPEPDPPPDPQPQRAAARPSLELHPHEWAWASWRPLPERSAPRPFDRAACAAAIRTTARSLDYGWRWVWSSAPFTGPLTSEEATAWLRVACTDRGSPAEGAREMAAYEPGSALAFDDACLLAICSRLPPGLPMAALVAVAGAEQVADWMALPSSGVKPAGQYQHWVHGDDDNRVELSLGTRAFLLPGLDDAVRARLTESVRERLAAAVWPAHDPHRTPDLAFFLAAQLGLHDELQRVVNGWPDDAYAPRDGWSGDYNHRPQAIAFGLGSPTAVRDAFERLDLHFRDPWHAAAWLAHTELAALDLAAAQVARATNRNEAAGLMHVLTRVRDPAIAPAMLELMRSSKAPALAREWLTDHPHEAFAGAAACLAHSGRVKDAAVDFLRTRKRAGEDLTTAVRGLPDDAAARVRELVLDHEDGAGPELARAQLPADLRAALDDVPAAKKKLPGWIELAALPPLRLGTSGHLAIAEVEDVLRACASASTDDVEAPPALRALAEHVDAGAREEFGWALFDSWGVQGAPPDAKWAIVALGWLGGDRTAIRLAPRIRAWPGESQHARAVLGLGVLRAIGSDTALMLLSGIAQKVKFKGLQTRAQEAMDAIAASKGMTKAELEDRIVPDCGLDERGSRTLDFGPRRFEFVLGPGLKPMVRDEAGKIRASLPKPGTRDDAVLAPRAVDEWKLLRKQVADVSKVQAGRLEQAMITQRRWTVAEFERFLVRHPLQRHMVRLLVWGSYRDDGTLASTFRVTDELDYADAGDTACALGDDAGSVGVVHPLQLDDAQRAAWGELLADYEVVPPFPQLGRPIHRLDPADATGEEITRWADRKIPAAALVRLLESLGWERGGAMDGGVFGLHAKAFGAFGITVVVEYEGIAIGAIVDWEDQSIDRCYVLDRALPSAKVLDYGWEYQQQWGSRSRGRVRWGDVDPIVCSEVLADIATLLEKAR